MTIKIQLYSADAPDQTPELAEVSIKSLNSRQLLWIDLGSPTAEEQKQVAELLGCKESLLRLQTAAHSRPELVNYTSCFRITANAVSLASASAPLVREALTLVAGLNFVVTVHEAETDFLDKLRDREKGESTIGALSAEEFVASQLDWLLHTYFMALEVLVRDIDRIEVSILSKELPDQILPPLLTARQRIADLRRLLKAHRDVFYGLARPDFMATEEAEVKNDYAALTRHFDRAEDDLENARDLVIGSFELLSTRAMQKTNETMRALTFITVLMGTLALVAGIMGMNFQVKFFETGMIGFATVTGGMLLFSTVAVLVAKKRCWI